MGKGGYIPGICFGPNSNVNRLGPFIRQAENYFIAMAMGDGDGMGWDGVRCGGMGWDTVGSISLGLESVVTWDGFGVLSLPWY